MAISLWPHFFDPPCTIYVEPLTSALDVTLRAFAAERRHMQQILIDSWYAVPTGRSAANQPRVAAAGDR